MPPTGKVSRTQPAARSPPRIAPEEIALVAAETARVKEIDAYGVGAPTDRLQFGYAPATAEEAVAFHSMFTAEAWRAERSRNYRTCVIKLQKLPTKHFEGLDTFFKLKKHWHDVAQQNQRGRSHTSGGGGGEDAEDFLKQLALQNVGVGAGAQPPNADDHATAASPPADKRHRKEAVDKL